MSPRRMISVSSWTLALTFACAAAAVADEVVLIPNATVKGAVGGRVRGTIQSETQSEVVVKLGETKTSVPTDQIVSIRYDGQPASLALAESAESQGQISKAIDLYKKAAGEATDKPLIEQSAKFKEAELTADLALADPGKAAEAVALLDAFGRGYASSRHTVAVLETMARLQIQKGDYAGVDKTLAALAKLPAGADRAAVLRARVLARKGDHAGAIAELDALIKSAPDGSDRQRDARLARVESLAAEKKFTEAEDEVRSVIKSLPAEDARTQAAAYNALGDCLRAAGHPKDALIAYLHTDILYSKDKEQHPRALAHIVQLWRELNRGDRADEALARLKQDYPQSPWLTSSRPTP